jgi:hypothetical protein
MSPCRWGKLAISGLIMELFFGKSKSVIVYLGVGSSMCYCISHTGMREKLRRWLKKLHDKLNQ